MSVTSHGEVLNIIALLQTDGTRAEIVDQLHLRYGEKDLVKASVDLVTRLWLTVAIGTLPNSLAPGDNVIWEGGKLSDIVRSL